MRTRLSFAIAIALVCVIGTAAPARAHTELIEASPGPGALLVASPSHVMLAFSTVVKPANDAVVVLAADGSRVSDGDPIVDANVLTASLRPLATGSYAVSYRVIADDSHVVEGTYQFTVATAAPATTQPEVAPAPSDATADPDPVAAAPASRREDEGSPFGVVLVIVAAVIGIMGGLAAWMMNRRDTR